MIFRYTILYVADVKASLEFYGRAFGLSQAFLHEGGDYGELRTGETKLAFSAISLMEAMGKTVSRDPGLPPAFEIALETDDVAAALGRALAAGAILVQDVSQMEWGQTLAYVRTPDGTMVELCTKVGG
jgi:lactoylglutathione lyase